MADTAVNRDLNAWARLDANWLHNPKVRKAGLYGRALYIAGLLYANRRNTDGEVSADVLDLLAAEAGLDSEQAAEAQTKLVEARLWLETEDGFHIHDYENCQETSSERESRRSSDRERQRRRRTNGVGCDGGFGHVDVTRDTNVTHSGVHDPDADADADADSECATSSPPGQTKRKPTRRSQVPEDFTPDETRLTWASENAAGADIKTETAKFVDYHRSKGNAYLDWQRAWVNWMRNARPTTEHQRGDDRRPRPPLIALSADDDAPRNDLSAIRAARAILAGA